MICTTPVSELGRFPLRTLTVVSLLVAIAVSTILGTASAETWRGLTVAPEHRCSPYERKRDYPYPQSVEQDIVRALGAVFRSRGPSDAARLARYLNASSVRGVAGGRDRARKDRAKKNIDHRSLIAEPLRGRSPGACVPSLEEPGVQLPST